ncbi:hypothetical protein [Pseudomonas sp. 273]|uniref:hypothetical protein n=1 Tax=Pseudomonas sp. 273 TaxID=75692 RepID=UPI0023D883DB|nr:hypothetical protein [Pseudomonas sp. 273]
MKKIVLVLAATLALPMAAMADSKLCDANLTQLKDFLATASKNATGVKVNVVQDHVDQAEKARAAGDYESCVNHTTQALRIIRKPANR